MQQACEQTTGGMAAIIGEERAKVRELCAEFDIEFGQGISTEGCILDLGIEHNVVSKSGSFFAYGDERLGQGRNNAKGYLREHPEMVKELEAKIYEAMGIPQPGAAPIAEVPPPADADADAEAPQEQAA